MLDPSQRNLGAVQEFLSARDLTAVDLLTEFLGRYVTEDEELGQDTTGNGLRPELARQIGRDITRRSKRPLEKIDSKHNTEELWRAVRQLTGREHEPAVDPRITADTLNRHYASVSTSDGGSMYDTGSDVKQG